MDDHPDPPPAAERRRLRAAKIVLPAMTFTTGAAALQWAHLLEGIDDKDVAWSFLLILAAISCWPAYVAWRAARRISARLDAYEQLAADGAQRCPCGGYATGYLQGVSDRTGRALRQVN